MTFNSQIDIGQVISVATFIGTAIAIIATVRAEIKGLRTLMDALGERLSHHETTVFNMAGQLQRLIGQVETRSEGDRRRRQIERP